MGAGLRAIPAHALQRGLQHLPRLDSAQEVAGAIGLTLADHVLQAKLGRVDAQVGGDQIRVALESEGVLMSPWCSKVPAGRRVGVDL